MIFAIDKLLVVESLEVNKRLEEWRAALQEKIFRISNTVVMVHDLGRSGQEIYETRHVTKIINDEVDRLKYLGLVVQRNGGLEEDQV